MVAKVLSITFRYYFFMTPPAFHKTITLPQCGHRITSFPLTGLPQNLQVFILLFTGAARAPV